MAVSVSAGVLTGLHVCSHVSFAVSGHYPASRGDVCRYTALRASDAITHLLVCLHCGLSPAGAIAALWFAWHTAKLLDHARRIRDLPYISALEASWYLYAALALSRGPPLAAGILAYTALRWLDLIW